MFLDYQAACRYAQLLDAHGVRQRVGVRHIQLWHGSTFRTLYQVISLP